MDNSPSHTSYYSMYNLWQLNVRIIFNCPSTPAYNVVESVFCDMKFGIRKSNKKTSDELVQAAREFLITVDENYMRPKILMSLKYFKKGLQSEDF